MWTPEQFWGAVEIGAPEACWPWKRAATAGGYGALGWCRRWDYAHRVAYELAVGPLIPGMEVCHSLECTTRLCCNPAHLRQDTKAGNMQDMAILGTARRKVLTDEQVLEARQLRRQGWTYVNLAARYPVSERAIFDAVKGRTYKYLKEV